MINIIPAVASAHSRRKTTSGLSKWEMEQTIREGNLQYGEVCYKCEKYIGDATGFPRVCSECPPDKEEVKKKKWWKFW